MLLSPFLAAAASASRQGSDYRSADGVRAVLDSLRPGVRTRLSLGTGAPDPVLLEGRNVICAYPGGSVSLPTGWALTNDTLLPGASYIVWLQGGVVQVAGVG